MACIPNEWMPYIKLNYVLKHYGICIQWNTMQDIKTRKAEYDHHCLAGDYQYKSSAVIVDWHCGPSTRAKLAKGAMELLIVDHVYFSGQRCDVAKDTYRCRHRCLGSKHFVFESVKSKSKEALCGQHPDFKVDDHPHFVQGKRVAMCGFEMKVLLLAMMMSVCGIIGIVDSKSVVSLVLSVLSLVLCHLPLIRIWKQIKLVLNIIGKAKIGVVIGSESRLMDLNCFLSWPVRIVSVSSSGAHLGRVQPLDTDDKWDKWIKSECTYGQSLEKNSICDVLHHNLYCLMHLSWHFSYILAHKTKSPCQRVKRKMNKYCIILKARYDKELMMASHSA